jgi:uncharacterized protein YbaR (Trm112 family)
MSETATDAAQRLPQTPRTDPKLLELLVCPLTKTTLEFDASKQELISRAAGLAFPIRNGVPLLIEDAARRLDDSDLRKR